MTSPSEAASPAGVLSLLLKHGFTPTTSALSVNYRDLHPGQQKVKSEMKRFNVACFGRRWGKTFFCIDWLVEPAVEKGLPVAWFAPTVKMWQEVWSDVVEVIGKDNIASKNIQMGRIELKNGGKIDFWSLESDVTVKGRKYARVVFDEAAHAERLENAWIYTVAPTLTDYKGEAFFISTPNGYNYFQTLYEFGNDPLKTDWQCWQMSSYENPHIDPAEIDMWKDMLPAHVFEQEYMAQFLRDSGKVFRNIDANLTAPDGATPEAHRGHRIISGVDWAQVKDFTVHSIGCDTCKVELFLERFNKIEFAHQRQRILLELVRWNVSECNVEQNSIGLPNYEELVASITKHNREVAESDSGQQILTKINAVQMTSESKPQMVQSMALSLEKEQFLFLSDKTAANELRSYEAKVNPNTGRISYSAPSGGHDDTVVARMMMLRAIHASSSLRIFSLRLR
jgi:hypothetical protein